MTQYKLYPLNTSEEKKGKEVIKKIRKQMTSKSIAD